MMVLTMMIFSDYLQYIIPFLMACITFSFLLLGYFRLKFHLLRCKPSKQNKRVISIAFFHPHCTGGGGGERVLWKAIESISKLNQYGCDDKGYDKKVDHEGKALKGLLHVVIYTSDKKRENYQQDVLQHVKHRFDISIPNSLPITFIHIPPMTLATNKRFTLVMESLYSIKLAYHALCQFTPHIYFDTTGCAFTFIIAKLLAGCKVVAYVHYPTISTDMLQLVWERRPSYNNTSTISKNKLFTWVKLIYYIVFAIMYGMVGSLADVILVNSTWTYDHISYLWRFHGFFNWGARKKKNKIHVLYPPCDINSVNTGHQKSTIPKRENNIISIGQFRPEKDHVKQIKSFAKLLVRSHNDNSLIPSDIKLLLIGSCRNESDYKRVEELQTLAYSTLALQKSNVEFIINKPYSVLQHYMATSLIGLHTMWNEHFGISVVEMMANGLITVAHNSGGPKSDIVSVPVSSKETTNRTGYLAHTEDEYVHAFCTIFSLTENEMTEIRKSAKSSCERFSDEVFVNEFKYLLSKVLLVLKI